MMQMEKLVELLKERFGTTRSIEDNTFKKAIINTTNDLISEFKQNICISEYDVDDQKKVIKIPNIACIFTAKLNNKNLPLARIAKKCEYADQTMLIVLDTQSVRIEPHTNGKLEILGSFYIDYDSDEIPLSPLFTRAILQGATLELYIALERQIENIKSADMLFKSIKDELRTQINRAQEKQSFLTKNIRI